MPEINNLNHNNENIDEDAFRQLFELYVRKVFKFIYKHVNDKAEAEDITQNVFIKIWERKIDFSAIRSLDAFIFTIAYRQILDYYRSNAAKFKKLVHPALDDDSFESALSAEEFINKHEFESVYERAIKTLPPKRREIFILSRHEGLSNNEIANRLDISVKTVENQMTAAISCLKNFFERSDFTIITAFGIFIFI